MHPGSRLDAIPARFWRPEAQRAVRNAFSAISGAQQKWEGAAASGLASAKELVNAALNERYVDTMDMGVLEDMPRIREHAKVKLHRQQEEHVRRVLDAYEKLVEAVRAMAAGVDQLRTFPPYASDGDGGVAGGSPGSRGEVAVFASLTLSTYVAVAAEFLEMFEKELLAKELLANAFRLLVYPHADEGGGAEESQKLAGHGAEEEKGPFLVGDRNGSGKDDTRGPSSRELSTPGNSSDKQEDASVSRETLQVYLTAWLAEVHLRKCRLHEIMAQVRDEMETR